MFNCLKKFLFISFVLMMPYMNLSLGAMIDEKTNITHTTAVKLGKPGPEEWKDSSGNPAPPNVRRAADNLWDAVENEGSAAGDAGWRYREDKCCNMCGAGRVIFAILCCGLNECCDVTCGKAMRPGNDGEFVHCDIASVEHKAKKLIWDQRTIEAKERLKDFKEAVNSSVLKPEGYSGDADMCTLGPWSKDNALVWNEPNIQYHSGRRDLSSVPQSTMVFVNKHGGWNPKADQILKTELRGNTLLVDF